MDDLFGRVLCCSQRCSQPLLHLGTHPRSAHGWYPAILGPNNAAAKGRIPYSILMLMDVLRAFPGQVGGRGGMAAGSRVHRRPQRVLPKCVSCWVPQRVLLHRFLCAAACVPLHLHLTTPLPRQIPDVDAVLHTADFTCIPRSWEDAGGGAPLPVIGFQVGWVG